MCGPLIVYVGLEKIGQYQPLRDAIRTALAHHRALASKGTSCATVHPHAQYEAFYKSIDEVLDAAKDLRAEGETSHGVGLAYIDDLVEGMGDTTRPPLSSFHDVDAEALGLLYQICTEVGLVEAMNCTGTPFAAAWTRLVWGILRYFNEYARVEAKRTATGGPSIFARLDPHISDSLESVVLVQHHADSVSDSHNMERNSSYAGAKKEAILAIYNVEAARAGASSSSGKVKTRDSARTSAPAASRLATVNAGYKSSSCYSAPYTWPLAELVARTAYECHNWNGFTTAWTALAEFGGSTGVIPLSMLRSWIKTLYQPFYDNGDLDGKGPPNRLTEKIWDRYESKLSKKAAVPVYAFHCLTNAALRFLCERLAKNKVKPADKGSFQTWSVLEWGCCHMFIGSMRGCIHMRHAWVVGEDYGLTLCCTTSGDGEFTLKEGKMLWNDIRSIRRKPTKWANKWVDIEIYNRKGQSDRTFWMYGLGELHIRMTKADADSLWEWVQKKAPAGMHWQDTAQTILHVSACEGRCAPPPPEPHFLYAVNHEGRPDAHAHSVSDADQQSISRHSMDSSHHSTDVYDSDSTVG